MQSRPRVHFLAVDDLSRAWDDPGLAALAAQGWTVRGLHPTQEEGGPVRLAVFLWPPEVAPWRPALTVALVVLSAVLGLAGLCFVTLAGVGGYLLWTAV